MKTMEKKIQILIYKLNFYLYFYFSIIFINLILLYILFFLIYYNLLYIINASIKDAKNILIYFYINKFVFGFYFI